jgi:hypothetical protein
MPALVAGINVSLRFNAEDVDGDDKPGHHKFKGRGEALRRFQVAVRMRRRTRITHWKNRLA